MYFLIFQDLRRDPSYTVPALVRTAPYQIQVLSDHCETKIGDPSMAVCIHKDI